MGKGYIIDAIVKFVHLLAINITAIRKYADT